MTLESTTEREIEELLIIVEKQGNMTKPQEYVLSTLLHDYSGSKYDEFWNRYLVVRK